MSGPTDDDLHGWVDGQLPPERMAEIGRWLAAHPAEAQRFERYREHRDRLRTLLAPKLLETIPARLTPEGLLRARRARQSHRLRNVAAGIVLLLVGGAGGWALRSETARPPSRLMTEAVAAHVTFVTEVRHPVEVPAAEEAHLVTWLSNRLGEQVRVPDLSRFGFRLIGGRLLPGEPAPAAQFMFEDPSGMRLTLYLHRQGSGGQGGGGTGFDVVQRDGVVGFRWFEAGFGYVVLAATDRQRLLQIAEVIYQQLPGGR